MKTKPPIASAAHASRLRAALLVASLSALASTHATILINLPDLVLQPNMAGQSFDIFVQNTAAPTAVQGISFNIQVADGGPDINPGSPPGPAISYVDVINGTIFNDSNTQQWPDVRNSGDGANGPLTSQLFWQTTTTSGGTVNLPESSKAATVTFDTTGFGPGVWTYTLDTFNGPTEYTDAFGGHLPVSLGDGTLTVVPEPSQYAAIFGGLCFGAVLVSRRLKRPVAKA